ncbi:MAG: hypothetical protein ISS19_18080 [Bacteroidales bacterium]|nr:hypothetical protein [Bacteroidales bacterium]
MRKYLYYLGLGLSIFALAICMNLTSSCEGPAGVAGEDANESCVQCHNDATQVLAKQLQTANSGHMTGGNFERSDFDCASCHTHEGFLDRMESGEMEASADISNPTPQNCRTCHTIHINYDSTDFALRYTDPVTLWVNDVTVDFGTGNLCTNCHQPRIIDPMPTPGGGDVTITSSRYGPHHGPQSAVIWGTGAFELAGSQTYAAPGSNAHVNAGCITCHMAEAYGNQAGGHTFRMGYEYHDELEPNLAGCLGCHSSIESFDYNDVQTEIEELFDSLGNVLVNKGFLKASGSVVTGTYDSDDAGVILNYKYIEEDKSMGIHNPKYVEALLVNSLEHLTK